ncbi:membrane-bound serine protease (ClpP class) [Sinobaca qinghaiensis]|uniref:Membrane-bound serine protease (ClpP class) n=2 Tax=Sinobaca TaxID=342943 RepID=A0A419V3Q7_9BACL|nr:nodulation protein NfeD [Sinobaca qinghaiensis]RKD73036.1 membrane-bound serine protease (ClpP class) [Sinobaca qinghaiensis]
MGAILIRSLVLAISAVVFFIFPFTVQADEDDLVYVIPVEQAVERGLESFLERSFEQAEEAGATHVILEIDTPGGAVDAAGNIASIVSDAPMPVTAYVTEEAMSAGAFIALSADTISMAPGTEMGAAQVIDGSGNAANDKAQSAWSANMTNAAQAQDRDPIYAEAMADPSVDLPEYRAEEGALLTLTPSEAEEVGYADYLSDDREQLLGQLGLENAQVEELSVSFAEQIARFVTNPVVIPILLSVGSIGLIMAVLTPGFGIPGILGIGALLLFFFGHSIAGFAGMESIILFLVGLVLLLIELFVPGFGIFGFLGITAMVGGLILASFSTTYIVISILVAGALAVGLGVIMIVIFGKKGPMQKLVLKDTMKKEEGYYSNRDRDDLLQKEAVALTPLHPSGSAVVDEERIDVVTEGGFIEKGAALRIIKVEGTRIIVRKI